MINIEEIQRKKAEGLLDVVDIQAEIKNGVKTHGKYSVSKSGKVRYDLSQTALIKDVFGIATNSLGQVAKQTGAYVKTLIDNPIKYNPNLSIKENMAESHKVMAKNSEAIYEAGAVNREAARLYKEDILNELANEPSGIQSFAAGLPILFAAQALDVRQAPFLYATSTIVGPVLGGAITKAIPKVSPEIASIIGRVVSAGGENAAEEAIDQITTYGEIIDKNAIVMGGITGGLFGAAVPLVGKGGSKIMNITREVSPKIVEAAKNTVKKSSDKYIQRIFKSGDTVSIKMNDLYILSKNAVNTATLTGKKASVKSIRKAGVTIEGVSIKTADEVYTPKIINYIVDNKLIKGVETTEQFSNYLDNPKQVDKIIGIIKKVSKNKKLSAEEKEAFEWYVKVLDLNRIKDIDVDVDGAIKATDTIVNGTQEDINNLSKNSFIEPEVETKSETVTKNKIPKKKSIKDKNKTREKPESKNLIKEVVKSDPEIDEGVVRIIESAVKRRLGLSEKVDIKNTTQSIMAIVKEFGKVVRKRNNIKSIDDLPKFYKNKYGIEFDIKRVDSISSGRLGEVVIDNGKYTINIPKGTTDEDVIFGILRHEIEHILDDKNSPDFNPKKFKFNRKNSKDLAEALNKSYGGHFKKYDNKMFELSYIINDELESVFGKELPDIQGARVLGFDIPEGAGKEYSEFMKDVVKETANEKNAIKRLQELKKRSDQYFQFKRQAQRIFNKNISDGQKARELKELIQLQNIIPFRIKKAQMEDVVFDMFKLEYEGNTLDMERIFDLFEKHDYNLMDYIFGEKEIPENFIEIEPQLLKLKSDVRSLIKNLASEDIKEDDIINGILYDSNLTVERNIVKDKIEKYLDNNNNLDVDKLNSGEKILDTDTDKFLSKEVITVTEQFSEDNKNFFNGPLERFEATLSYGNENVEYIKSAMVDLKGVLNYNEIMSLIQKYELEDNKDIVGFLNEHANIFSSNKKSNINKIFSDTQKRNAKRAFIDDLSSFKGAENNKFKGTYGHKFGRFDDWYRRGYISRENAAKFAKKNRVDQRVSGARIFDWVTSAYAAREAFPGGSKKFFNRAINELHKQSFGKSFPTFEADIDRYIKGQLGVELGFVNKAPRSKLDDIVDSFIRKFNTFNLIGPKALKEFPQEGLSMSRGALMGYGGAGTIETFREIMNAGMLLIQNGDNLKKIDRILGSRWRESVPLEYFNRLFDDISDISGYKKKRLALYGSNVEKIATKIDTGLNAAIWYPRTQRTMKLASYLMAGKTMEKVTKYDNITDAIKNISHGFGRTLKNLEIDDMEFQILKKFQETKALKELGLFDEIEFKEIIKKSQYEDFLKRKLTDEEFFILRDDTVKKARTLYEKIASDMSPTETDKSARIFIDEETNAILRNFYKLTGNFKNSVQVQWGRAINDYYSVNVNENGKFDWSNTLYQKRLLGRMIGIGLTLATISATTDLEFYDDPLEYVSDMVDEFIDNPFSTFWQAMETQGNFWALTNGSNIVQRPLSFGSAVSKGDFEKAAETLIKTGLGTYNFNAIKFIYDEM